MRINVWTDVQWLILATKFENRQTEENYSENEVPVTRGACEKTSGEAWT